MATFADLLLLLRADASDVDAKLKSTQDGIEKLGEGLDLKKLRDGFLEIAAMAGIATGAFEIAKEALVSFAKAEDVKTSFELLTGSADRANAAFDGLKDTALRLALPFEELVSVSQRLAPQFGVGTTAMAATLQAAGDAAAATGRSFSTIADGLDRIAITGQVSTRQMFQFGVSMQDIATAMGVSVTEAIALLKKGGQDAQSDVNAIVAAIEAKFGGAAEKIGENLTGQLTKLKDELGFISEDLGKALAPVAEDLIAGLKDMEPTLKVIADATVLAVTGFKDMTTAIGGVVPEFVKIALSAPSMIALGTAVGFVGAALAAIVDTAHGALVEIAALGNAILTGDWSKVPTVFAATGDAMQKAWVTNFQEIATRGDEMQQKLDGAFLDAQLGAQKSALAMFGLAESLKQPPPLIDAITQAYKDLGVKLPPTQAELDKVANSFELISGQYEKGLIPLSQYDAAVDSFTKKMTSLQGAFVAATLPADELGKALKLAGIKDASDELAKLQAGVAAASTGFDNGRTSASAYAAEIDKLTAFEQKNSTDGIAGLTTALSIAGEDFVRGKTSIQDYAAALDNLIAAMPATQDAILKQSAAIAGLGTGFDILIRNIPTTEGALKNLGLQTMPQLNRAVELAQKDFDAVTEAFKRNEATSQDVAIAWGRLHDAQVKISEDKLDQQKLGIPDLEILQRRVNDANTAYEDLASKGLLNATTALEGQVTKQRDAIDLAVQMGQDTTNLRIDLDATTEALKRQTLGFSDLAASLKGVELSGIQGVFHDLLFDVGSIGDAFKKLGESMVDTVVNRILKDALSPLLDSLDKVIVKGVQALEGLLGIGTGGGGVLGTTVGAAGGAAGTIGSTAAMTSQTAATTANTAALSALTAALSAATGAGAAGTAAGAAGGVAQAGGGAASAASGAIGAAIAPLAGIITGAISAVTGVISVFQNMHQETSLNAIELNTRITSILLGSIDATGKGYQDADNVKVWTKTIGVTILEIKAMLYATIHTDLVGIWGAISSISAPKQQSSDFSAITGAISDQSIGIVNELKNIEGYDWGSLHSDLVGIWNSVGASTNLIVPRLDSLITLLSGGAISVSPTVSVSSTIPSSGPAAINFDAVTAPLKTLTDIVSTNFGLALSWGAGLSVKVEQLTAFVSASGETLMGILNGISSAAIGMSGMRDSLNSINANLVAIKSDTVAISQNTARQPTFTGNVYLDAQELFASFVRWSQQSGNVVPGY